MRTDDERLKESQELMALANSCAHQIERCELVVLSQAALDCRERNIVLHFAEQKNRHWAEAVTVLVQTRYQIDKCLREFIRTPPEATSPRVVQEVVNALVQKVYCGHEDEAPGVTQLRYGPYGPHESPEGDGDAHD